MKMSKSGSPENPKKLMTELDDLVHFLADGPEVQQEMRLPQDELFPEEDTSEGEVPMLTTPVDENTTIEINPELDKLVNDLVDQLMPKLETELRRRLKNKFSDSAN